MLIDPQVYAANLPYAKAALAGQPQRFERTFVDRAGLTRHTLVFYTPNTVSGVVQGMFVLVTDITSHVETQEQLRETVGHIAVLDDRHRIAEDLHDLVIQHLFACTLTLQAIDPCSNPAFAARVVEVAENIEAAMLTLRRSINQLNSVPPAQDPVPA